MLLPQRFGRLYLTDFCFCWREKPGAIATSERAFLHFSGFSKHSYLLISYQPHCHSYTTYSLSYLHCLFIVIATLHLHCHSYTTVSIKHASSEDFISTSRVKLSHIFFHHKFIHTSVHIYNRTTFATVDGAHFFTEASQVYSTLRNMFDLHGKPTLKI